MDQDARTLTDQTARHRLETGKIIIARDPTSSTFQTQNHVHK